MTCSVAVVRGEGLPDETGERQQGEVTTRCTDRGGWLKDCDPSVWRVWRVRIGVWSWPWPFMSIPEPLAVDRPVGCLERAGTVRVCCALAA